MLSLDRQTLDALAIAGVAAGAVGTLLGLSAHARLSRLRRAFSVLDGPDGRETVVAALNRQLERIDQLAGEVNAARQEGATARRDVANSLRHVAVVRYDAFGDMGGRLSFSAALLDDAGDGLVLTSINGRSETRTYAKGVKAGNSEVQLSPEELQAIDVAVRGTRAGASR